MGVSLCGSDNKIINILARERKKKLKNHMVSVHIEANCNKIWLFVGTMKMY